MLVKLVYVNSGPLQRGSIVSVRTETGVDQSTVYAPSAIYNPDKLGIADCCDITDWIDVTDFSAIFERGEMTVDPETKQLVSVIDTQRNDSYLKNIALEQELEELNGNI